MQLAAGAGQGMAALHDAHDADEPAWGGGSTVMPQRVGALGQQRELGGWHCGTQHLDACTSECVENSLAKGNGAGSAFGAIKSNQGARGRQRRDHCAPHAPCIFGWAQIKRREAGMQMVAAHMLRAPCARSRRAAPCSSRQL